MKEEKIWKDEKGVFGLPVQYMVALIVAGIAIALMSFAGYQLYKDMQVKEAIREADKIVKEAELMYNTADKGTAQTVDVKFPSGMRKVVFGSSNLDNANRYYVIMDWGQNKSFYSKNVNFGVAVLYEGIGSVTLELETNNGGKYVKITPT
ncbi:MAG: hypothetical protein U9O96_02790 [Candidatus Thermoplasmatota archaeon]|nr:hypothetical protein [Candidatus Thermoplasmatota archaeon]